MEEKVNISIHNCSIGYHGRKESIVLLKDISLQVSQGELVALIGKNGSGKTTFLRSLVGFQKLLSGNIQMNGRDIQLFSNSEIARRIGFVSTFIPDSSEMTVEELIRIGRYPYTNIFGSINDEDRVKIQEAIETCGLADLRKKKITELSDGERQRSMLARVFAQNTPVILLDEPTSFLDIPNKFDIFNLLRDLSARGRTIIFTTHDLGIASKFADKLWLISGNRIIEGAPEDLYLQKNIQKQFMSSRLVMDPETGEFGPVYHSKRSLRLNTDKNCGLAEKWTRKALERKGIGVNNEESDTGITLTIFKEKNDFIWKLQMEDEILLFTSILNLITKLENLIGHELN